MTRAEKETIIRWDAEERSVSVYSCSAAVWARCERLKLTPGLVVRDSTGQVIAREYVTPLNRFRWGVMSEARSRASKHRAALASNTPVNGGPNRA